MVELCEKMMKSGIVRLAGLGCRDILRTEAGLCLYGNELSDVISPVQAGLSWCIGKCTAMFSTNTTLFVRI